MDWKKAWRGVMAVVVAGAMLAGNGCSTNWVQQAEQIVAALIPAAANMVALVAVMQGKTVSPQDLQTIQNAGTQAGADLQLIQSLIQQYQSADSAAKAGLLSRIEAAIATAQANLNGILPALHIKDAATQAKITAVVGIVLAEVQSLAAMVPLVNPNASAKMVAMAERQVKQRPPLTAGQFVQSYNAAMTAKTGNEELDRAAGKMAIHLHRRWERVTTVGGK
jgi:hypothetical protein